MTHDECKAAILAREAVRDAAHPSTEHELRQQLADVSNERDGLRVEHDKRYRALIDMRDERDVLQLQLNASEERNAELARYIVKADALLDELGCPLDEVIDLFEAQSAPATDEQGAK